MTKADLLQATLVSITLCLNAAAQSSSVTEVVKEEQAETPWTQAPTAFRGVSFGSSEAEAAKTLKLTCRDASIGKQLPYRECTPIKKDLFLKIAGQSIRDVYTFYEDKLVQVELGASWSRSIWTEDPPSWVTYEQILTAITEKYGPPTYHKVERHKGVSQVTINTYSGRARGSRIDHVPFEFDYHKLEWTNDAMHASLRGREGHDGFASVETVAWRTLREGAEKAQRPTSDF